MEAAARSDALFEKLSRRLAAAGVHLDASSPCERPPEPPVFRVAVPLSRGASMHALGYDDAGAATAAPRRPAEPRLFKDGIALSAH